MKLELYEEFKRRKPLDDQWRDSDETQTLRSMRPMILEQKLRDLKEIVEFNDLDDWDWWTHVDSTLTVEENINNWKQQFDVEIPSDYNEKYGPTREERSKRIVRQMEKERPEQKPAKAQQEPDQAPAEGPSDDVVKYSIRTDERDDGVSESDDSDGQAIVTSLGSESYDPPATDEYGFGSLRLPEELLCLLERAKVENEEFNSKRAVIEAMVRNVGHYTGNFEDENENFWSEFHATLERSRDVPCPNSED